MQTPAEHGAPADGRAFRRALGQFATGVTVIGTVHEGRGYAMAANSFSAVSLEPPLVLWSIRKESKSAPAFTSSGHFSINVLEEAQTAVSNALGRSHEDPLSQVDWSAGVHGDPLLSGCLAQFECTTESVVDGGDHHILVGRVERFARFEGKPLLFAQGEYGWLGRRSDTGSSQLAAAPSEEMLFMSLLRDAEQHMSTLFDSYRRQLGLTPTATRILNHLAHSSDTVEGLQRSTPIAPQAIDDSLAELMQAGLVNRAATGTWSLTEQGLARRASLRKGAEEFTARQLDNIPANDLAAAERVLAALCGR
nr:flavin reductase [Nocardioides sp. Iso805N]